MTDQPPDPRADPTPPRRPRQTGPVQYKGDDLEAERGPGLGCFRIQLVVLVVFIVLTPLSVAWNWPIAVSTILLFAVIGLLLVTGQTIIFLLRLVAADRRGRRRPLASGTRTVGELEDAAGDTDAPSDAGRRRRRRGLGRRRRRGLGRGERRPWATGRRRAHRIGSPAGRRPAGGLTSRGDPAVSAREGACSPRGHGRVRQYGHPSTDQGGSRDRARARDLLLRPPRP